MTLQKELWLKDWGKEASASTHQAELELAKDMAIKLAALKGEVSINDVREYLPTLPSGNYLGSTFKGSRWLFTGRYEKARHKGSHARDVKVWKLAA
jgi:hypothetical protein